MPFEGVGKMFFLKIRNISLALVLIFVFGMVAGCSTTGDLKMHQSVNGKTIKAAVVALIVTPPSPKENNVAIQLRGQVAAQLLGAGLFKSITDQGSQDADYEVNIKLTRVDEVSGVSRVLLGALAGSNKIAGNVTVIDAKTKQTVRSFSFRGESAAHPFSGKSDISDAISKSAEEIIKGLS